MWVLKRARKARQLYFGPFSHYEDYDGAALSTLQSQNVRISCSTLRCDEFDGNIDELGTGFAMVRWIFTRESTLRHLCIKYKRINIRKRPFVCHLTNVACPHA